MLVRVLKLAEETATLHEPSIHEAIADVQFVVQVNDECGSGYGDMHADYQDLAEVVTMKERLRGTKQGGMLMLY